MAPKPTDAHKPPPFHKYLKPGALALLRDSRINAKAHRLNDSLLRSLLSVGRPQQNNTVIITENLPCLSPRKFGPRFVQRKRLMAVNSVVSVNTSEPAAASSQ